MPSSIGIVPATFDMSKILLVDDDAFVVEAYMNRLSKQAKPLFTLEQLEPVIQRLDERCRTVEF